MIIAFLLLVAGVVGMGLVDWRKGVLLCIPIGFLQDPIRKIAPGQNVAWVVTVAVCFVACLVGALLRGRGLGVGRLLAYYPRLRAPVTVFVGLVLIESAVTLFGTGSFVLAGLGLLSYLSPPLALLLGYRFCATLPAFNRWRRLYLIGAMTVAVTVVIQLFGYESPFFESIGVDIVYGTSGVVEMLPGIMRSSEIAAWHLATGLCLVLVLAVLADRSRARFFAVGLAICFFVALLLTGRRKMLGEVALFGVLFAVLLIRHGRGFSRALRLVLVAGLAVVVVGQLMSHSTSSVLVPYVKRGITVVAESTTRLEGMTVGQFGYVIDRNGFFGSGAGTGAQGGQYFGGGTDVVGFAAEGGLGKVLAELGVPGLTALAWLGVVMGSVFLRIARGVRRLPLRLAAPAYGLIALLPANLAVFVTAHQVYGDPFVLIVLGWVSGAALAVPKMVRSEGLVERELHARTAPRSLPSPVVRGAVG